MSDVLIPDGLRARLEASPEGRARLGGMPAALVRRASAWGVELGYAVDGPGTAFVVRGRRGDVPVLLVFSGPGTFERELAILDAAGGHGYPILLEADARAQALLTEGVGAPPDSFALAARRGPDAVTGVLAATLREAWSLPRTTLPTGPHAHPAQALIDVILSSPPTAAVPDCGPAIDRALAYAQRRSEEPSRTVIVHGDATLANLRAVQEPRPGAESGYVLVHPVGMLAEPEYDLGTLLRDDNRGLLGAEDPVVWARERCARLAEAVGCDAESTWQWAYLQRVARGLSELHGPTPLAGRSHLQSAMALISRRRG